MPKQAIGEGPYLVALGAREVTVRFELATAASAQLRVEAADVADASDGGAARSNGRAGAPGLGPDGGSAEVLSDGVARFHSITARHLAPAKTYRYTVSTAPSASGSLDLANARISASGTFTTAPDEGSGAPFSFLIYGDNRSDDLSHAAVVKVMLGARGDFLLHTGDFVEDGRRADHWQSFFDIERPLLRDRAIFACIGNHELVEQTAANYLRYFGSSSPPSQPPTDRANLYGTFRWGNTRFFLLNAFDAWISGDERDWLESQLVRAATEPGVAFRVAVLHHGPYSAGPHGDNTRFIRAGLPEILERNGVDLVVSGHDHDYERGFEHGLRYLVSGGGGAPLYDVTPRPTTRKAESVLHFVEASVRADGMRFVARRVDGSVIEACGFPKRKGPATGLSAENAWDCDDRPVDAAGTAGAGANQGPAALDRHASERANANANANPSVGASKCACRAAGAPAHGSELRGFLAAAAGAFGFLRRWARRRPRRTEDRPHVLL